MATHSHKHDSADEKIDLGPLGPKVCIAGLIIGIVGIAAALLVSLVTDGGMRRFYFAYLISYAFFLSIALGCLFFTLLQHITRAGWSVNIRRLAENYLGTLPVMGVLALPIILSVALSGFGGNTSQALYRWAFPHTEAFIADSHGAGHGEEHHPGDGHDHSHDAHGEHGDAAHAGEAARPVEPGQSVHAESQVDTGPGHAAAQPGDQGMGESVSANTQALRTDAHAETGHAVSHAGPGSTKLDELTLHKRPWLNPGFFIARIVGYFVVFSLIAWFLLSTSRRQDATGELSLTNRMQSAAPGLMVIFGLLLTFLSFDLLMSLDPHWYSTMFGVYYFAGSVGATFATLILTVYLLQRGGFLTRSIHVEHYHDMGKFLFGFTFFWGYIAFSQYMLLWYANIPETVGWLERRGATTSIPGLMISRPDGTEVFNYYAIVLLALLFLRFIFPFAGLLSRHVKRNKNSVAFFAAWILVFHWLDLFWLIMPELDGLFNLGLPELAALIGIGGLFVAAFARNASAASLRPIRDPRAPASTAVYANP